MCLPVSTYSRMLATVDLHNLFHFLRLRLHSHAQWEIRQYAQALLLLIRQHVPVAASAFISSLRGQEGYGELEHIETWLPGHPGW